MQCLVKCDRFSWCHALLEQRWRAVRSCGHGCAGGAGGVHELQAAVAGGHAPEAAPPGLGLHGVRPGGPPHVQRVRGAAARHVGHVRSLRRLSANPRALTGRRGSPWRAPAAARYRRHAQVPAVIRRCDVGSVSNTPALTEWVLLGLSAILWRL